MSFTIASFHLRVEKRLNRKSQAPIRSPSAFGDSDSVCIFCSHGKLSLFASKQKQQNKPCKNTEFNIYQYIKKKCVHVCLPNKFTMQ